VLGGEERKGKEGNQEKDKRGVRVRVRVGFLGCRRTREREVRTGREERTKPTTRRWSWCSRRTDRSTRRSSACSATVAARPCASMAPSASAISAARCTRRSGSLPVTSSSSASGTTRTTRPTSSSSTCLTRPDSLRPTASSPTPHASTRALAPAWTRRTKPPPTTTSSSRMRTSIKSNLHRHHSYYPYNNISLVFVLVFLFASLHHSSLYIYVLDFILSCAIVQ